METCTHAVSRTLAASVIGYDETCLRLADGPGDPSYPCAKLLVDPVLLQLLSQGAAM